MLRHHCKLKPLWLICFAEVSPQANGNEEKSHMANGNPTDFALQSKGSHMANVLQQLKAFKANVVQCFVFFLWHGWSDLFFGLGLFGLGCFYCIIFSGARTSIQNAMLGYRDGIGEHWQCYTTASDVVDLHVDAALFH